MEYARTILDLVKVKAIERVNSQRLGQSLTQAAVLGENKASHFNHPVHVS